ncbi:glycogen synthase GlgA [uncultured Gilvimarinus sp.]|uniref:glycogen synthase GlgA n=1 Tax=uncultured Gilvimarinus sp. TaxID=1689143 RepID=UPI0030DA9B56
MKVLFACSEAYPLAKTGGLGDVGGALPRALARLGVQVRLLLPAYKTTLEKARPQGLKLLREFEVNQVPVKLWQSRLPGSRVPVWLVDIPEFSDRAGSLYGDDSGTDWPDNPYRFYLFSKVAEHIALNKVGLHWRPDVVHSHDWQVGLVPALLAGQQNAPASVFTIHNLAYRGIFDYQTFVDLQLPEHWWHYERLEFWGNFSFLKAGLVYADAITTVSPSYAQEIQTEQFGCGLEGVLVNRARQLTGIVNGIDTDTWNPGADPYLAVPYSRRTIKRKVHNKLALQRELGLPEDESVALVGFIGRLVEQKGVALILGALPALLSQARCQFVVIGSGQPEFEAALQELRSRYPQRVSVTIGYDESLSHRIEAGSDIFLMPSLFEPCGLNQMYSQRYGTIPVANFVGGLRDTIVNFSNFSDAIDAASMSALVNVDETGFLFSEASVTALSEALRHALTCFDNKLLWRKLQDNAMSQDFAWGKSARAYLELYRQTVSRTTQSNDAEDQATAL